MLNTAARGGHPDPEKLAGAVRAAVRDTVAMQQAAGLTIVTDGEMAQLSYLDTASRPTGPGYHPAGWYSGDQADTSALPPAGGYFSAETTPRLMPSCNGPVHYRPDAATARIAAFEEAIAALDGGHIEGARLTALSPGLLARRGNPGYRTDDDFLAALATALHQECQQILRAGFDVQIDCPELAYGWHSTCKGMPLGEYHQLVARHIQAINQAVADLPRRRIWMHVCWGNYPGPHHHDLPLAQFIDLLYTARVGTLMLSQANPRHRHESAVFGEHPLPAEMKIAVGVIDTLTSTVESAQTVANGLIDVACHVGPERVIASTDCGFETFAAVPAQTPEVVALKLRALVEGAEIASMALCG
jgi:5-methyltetrahydropteroyltriglutamate--homocysteine methyltransferase